MTDMLSDGIGTHQPRGEDNYQCREVKAERDRLRQRVEELESKMRGYEQEILIISRRLYERGERMKALWREYENGSTKEFRMEVCDWFDETGEPL